LNKLIMVSCSTFDTKILLVLIVILLFHICTG